MYSDCGLFIIIRGGGGPRSPAISVPGGGTPRAIICRANMTTGAGGGGAPCGRGPLPAITSIQIDISMGGMGGSPGMIIGPGPGAGITGGPPGRRNGEK